MTPTQNILLVIEFIILLFIFVPTMIAFLGGAPWVPTPTVRVKKMLELAKIKPGEKIYDIGCGDGRMVILANKLYKADAVGIDLSPIMYWVAKLRNRLSGGKAKFILGDLRKQDISDANVIVFYLLPGILKKMSPTFSKLKPGTRLISYAFSIEGWEPTYIEPKNPEKNLARILIYTVGISDKKYDCM